MRDDVTFSQVINELAQSWQIKSVNSPLLFGKAPMRPSSSREITRWRRPSHHPSAASKYNLS